MFSRLWIWLVRRFGAFGVVAIMGCTASVDSVAPIDCNACLDRDNPPDLSPAELADCVCACGSFCAADEGP